MPVVFQCLSCKEILSDSTSILEADAKRKTFSVERVSENVGTKKTEITSVDRKDKGCVYVELYCKACSSVVGKRYVTVRNDSLSKAGAYVLSRRSVKSYRLGSGTRLNCGATVGELSKEIAKIQKVCTVLYNEVQELKRNSKA